MPNYKGHLVGGFATYIVLLFLLRSTNPSLITAAQWLVICLLGALFPDVDTKSKIQKIFYTGFVILLFFLISLNKLKLAVFLSVISLSPLVVNHRGIFHKAWFIILITVAFVIFTVEIKLFHSCSEITIPALFFTAGALSHIILDMGIKQLFKL
ncbi:MAG: metal-dependent hydrolase [Candidatus Babeliales bacterium]|nr:metal-dependent hydrolase [Candidatus Babeliales bacterium]